VLSENIKDPELAKFYRDLMISEAGHYTTFLGFARKYMLTMLMLTSAGKNGLILKRPSL
jgi:tRNA isopentenyl-2-thiomethyl-A-37 hydroxylase MiaE